MTRNNLCWVIGVPVLLLVTLAVSSSLPARTKDKDYQLIRTLVDVLAEVDQRYVRKLSDDDKQRLVEDMISGGLERLDPYSSYLSSRDLTQFNQQTEGNFVGIGIQLGVDPKTGRYQVLSPMFGTPAYDAGILPGDIILKVDDASTENLRFPELLAKIQGQPGTEVKLTILHENSTKPEVISIKRARIEVSSVAGFQHPKDKPNEWDWYADKEAGVAYVRITDFKETTVDDFRKVIEQLQKENARGLILDLRDNPGGLLRSAVSISDMFLNAGMIVSTKDRNGYGPSYAAEAKGTLMEPAEKYPLVVLINRSSASASEIVAAALQDNNRAILMGERSYGKGSVQRVIDLPTNPPSAIKLTVESYWRPNGKNIHRDTNDGPDKEWGVSPNPGFEVPLTDEERIAAVRLRRLREAALNKKTDDTKPGEDLLLNAAVEFLKSGKKPTPRANIPEGSRL